MRRIRKGKKERRGEDRRMSTMRRSRTVHDGRRRARSGKRSKKDGGADTTLADGEPGGYSTRKSLSCLSRRVVPILLP